MRPLILLAMMTKRMAALLLHVKFEQGISLFEEYIILMSYMVQAIASSKQSNSFL